MPRSLDPATPLELVLEVDRDQAQPPTFLAQHMTARQWLKFAAEYDQLFATATLHEQLQRACELLAKYIVGWQGMATPFDADALPDLLTASEAMELTSLLYRQGRLGYADKKKSASPPSSSSDNSAATAAAASASTPPPS